MAPPASHPHVSPSPDRPGQPLAPRLAPLRPMRVDLRGDARSVEPRRRHHDIDFLQRLREAGL